MADDFFSPEQLQGLYQQAAQPLPESVTAYAQPGAADYTNLDFYAPTFDFTSFQPSMADYVGGAEAAGGPGRRPSSVLGFYVPGQDATTAALTQTPLRRVSPFEAGGTIVDSTGGAAPEQKGFLDQILGKADLGKLLTGGLGAILGYTQQQKAAEEAARARAEYQAAATKAATEYRDLARPTLQEGQTQLSQAIGGTLSPAGLQQLEAARAQIAQGRGRGSSVSSMQEAETMTRIRNQILSDQVKMATALIGAGMPEATAAVNAELQGTVGGLNLELNLAQQSNAAAARMYQSLASAIGYGGGPQQQQQPQQQSYGASYYG